METRLCKGCNTTFPLVHDHFNQLSGGTWRHKCKACRRAASKKHHEENPEMTAIRRERYKGNLARAEGGYSQSDVEALCKSQGNLCFYCASILNDKAEVDHKTPLSRGGSNWPENICLACQTCNRDKNNKSAAEYMIWRRRLGLCVNSASSILVSTLPQ